MQKVPRIGAPLHKIKLRITRFFRHRVALDRRTVVLHAVPIILGIAGFAWVVSPALIETKPVPESKAVSQKQVAKTLGGSALLNRRCVICHSLDPLAGRKGSFDDWSHLITRMRDKGAPIMPEEADRIAAYLTKNPLPAAPAGSSAEGAVAQASNEPAGSAANTGKIATASTSQPGANQAGGKLLSLRCTTCHDLQRVESQRRAAEGWAATIQRMISKGAAVSSTEKPSIISYLASNYGTAATSGGAGSASASKAGGLGAVSAKAPSSGGATGAALQRTSANPQGKALFQQKCSACHSTSLPAAQKRTSSQWNATVGRMISKGCGITAAEKKLIVSYLASAFGPRPATGGAVAKTVGNRTTGGTRPVPSGDATVPTPSKAAPGGAASAQGKVLFEQRCSACHSTSIPAAQKRTAVQWSATVDRMISKGCPVTPGEKTAIVSYLAATYGPPKSTSPSAPGGTVGTGGAVAKPISTGGTTTASPSNTATASGQGKVLFEQRCSACHSTSIPAAQKRTAVQWSATVDRMISKGCPVTPGEKTAIVSYLAATYGPETATATGPAPSATSPGTTTSSTAPASGGVTTASPTPSTGGSTAAAIGDGQVLFEQRCSACHSTSIPAAQRRTAAEWSATVDRMISKGCSLNAGEKNSIVSYLAATYGPAPAAAPAPAPTPTPGTTAPPPSSQPTGKALFESKCLSCHGIQRIAEKEKDLRHWLKIIDDMVENGLSVANAERQAIGEYLAVRYPDD